MTGTVYSHKGASEANRYVYAKFDSMGISFNARTAGWGKVGLGATPPTEREELLLECEDTGVTPPFFSNGPDDIPPVSLCIPLGHPRYWYSPYSAKERYLITVVPSADGSQANIVFNGRTVDSLNHYTGYAISVSVIKHPEHGLCAYVVRTSPAIVDGDYPSAYANFCWPLVGYLVPLTGTDKDKVPLWSVSLTDLGHVGEIWRPYSLLNSFGVHSPDGEYFAGTYSIADSLTSSATVELRIHYSGDKTLNLTPHVRKTGVLSVTTQVVDTGGYGTRVRTKDVQMFSTPQVASGSYPSIFAVTPDGETLYSLTETISSSTQQGPGTYNYSYTTRIVPDPDKVPTELDPNPTKEVSRKEVSLSLPGESTVTSTLTLWDGVEVTTYYYSSSGAHIINYLADYPNGVEGTNTNEASGTEIYRSPLAICARAKVAIFRCHSITSSGGETLDYASYNYLEYGVTTYKAWFEVLIGDQVHILSENSNVVTLSNSVPAHTDIYYQYLDFGTHPFYYYVYAPDPDNYTMETKFGAAPWGMPTAPVIIPLYQGPYYDIPFFYWIYDRIHLIGMYGRAVVSFMYPEWDSGPRIMEWIKGSDPRDKPSNCFMRIVPEEAEASSSDELSAPFSTFKVIDTVFPTD